MEHTLGKFDSWEIVREDVARKTCDKSFYEHNGSGIPQNIRWFFAAEELAPGARKNIVVVYDGNDYSGNVQRGSDELARTRIFWDSTLTSHFKAFSNDGKSHVAQFRRVGEDRFELTFIHGVGFGFEKIISFLEQYREKNYIAPEKAGADAAAMREMKQRGQEARELFIHFGKQLAEMLPGVEYSSCSNWINQGQIVPIYFWLELKKPEWKKYPNSLSVSIEKFGDLFPISGYGLSVRVDTRDVASKAEDYKRQELLLELPIGEGMFYEVRKSSGDYGSMGSDTERVKEACRNGSVTKVEVVKPVADLIRKDESGEILQETADCAREIYSYYEYIMEQDGWWPSLSEYDPGITAEQYEEILRRGYTNNKKTLATLYYLYKMGGEGTCAEIAKRYGGKASTYLGQTNGVMQYVANASGCPMLLHNNGEGKQFVPVLFYGKNQTVDGQGIYRWKLREPLEKAIRKMDESGFFVDLEIEENGMSDFSRNMILYGPPGTGKTYYSVIYAVAICEGKSLDEVKAEDYSEVLARFNELKKKGQVLFTTFHQSYGYEEFIEGIRPVMSQGDNHGELHYEISDGIFKRICTAASALEGSEVDLGATVWSVRLKDGSDNEIKRECFAENTMRIDLESHEDRNGDYGRMLDMQPGDFVISYGGDSYCIDGIGVVERGDPYIDESKAVFRFTRKVNWLLSNVSIDVKDINGGKALPNHLVARNSNVRIPELIQVINENGGGQYRNNTKPYVLIIDEINRGNISKIFGELITLIEETKRAGAEEAMEAVLPYSGEVFSVPDNVYLLGTMNTADRSIALMDTALRRRFEFREMMPDTSILNAMGVGAIIANGETINVAKMLDVINQRIEYLYDREHTIGHAFFTKLKEDPSLEALGKIFEEKVIPLLQEYFYEDYEKIQLVLGDNGKEDEFKFILDQDIKLGDVFYGSPDVDLPEKKYTIQHEAFYKAESYKRIAKNE